MQNKMVATVRRIFHIIKIVLFKIIIPTLAITFLLLLLSRFIMEGIDDYYNYFYLHPIVYLLRSIFSLDDITCYSLIYISAFLILFSARQFYLNAVGSVSEYKGVFFHLYMC